MDIPPRPRKSKSVFARWELPKLEISRLVSRVVRDEHTPTEIELHVPTDVEDPSPIVRNLLTPNFTRGGSTSPLTGIEESEKNTGD